MKGTDAALIPTKIQVFIHIGKYSKVQSFSRSPGHPEFKGLLPEQKKM